MQMATRSLATGVILFLSGIALMSSAYGQEAEQAKSRDLIGYTSESNARYLATRKVLPLYPEEAVSQGISGVVEIGIGRNDRGEVIKMRVPPKLDPLLQKAVVTAVKQWRFEPYAVYRDRPNEYHINRLTFNFIIEDGKGRVELYDPPYDSPAFKRIRGAGPWDVKEWNRWAEVTEDN
jgi:TonB family protein